MRPKTVFYTAAIALVVVVAFEHNKANGGGVPFVKRSAA